MPSEWSDSYVRLINEQPKVIVQILRDMGIDLPPDAPVSLAPHPRDILETIAADPETLRYDASTKRHYAAGFAAGLARGEARARAEAIRSTIRIFLEARDLALSDDQDRRIEDCDDLDVLKKWAGAALTAKDAGEIFV